MNVATIRAAMLPFIANLSKYGFLEITSNEGEKFYSTGVDYNKRMPEFIIFQRLFATPIMPEFKVVGMELLPDDTVLCYMSDGGTYHIRGLKLCSEILDDCPLKDIYLHTLARPNLFTKHHYYKEIDLLVMVVDPNKLGMLSNRQYSAVRKIINQELGGSSLVMQACRTICFQVNMQHPQKKVYAGIYNLETEVSVTSHEVFNIRQKDCMPDDECNVYLSLINYAAQVDIAGLV